MAPRWWEYDEVSDRTMRMAKQPSSVFASENSAKTKQKLQFEFGNVTQGHESRTMKSPNNTQIERSSGGELA